MHEDVRQQLAALEHQRWSEWFRELQKECTPDNDGSLIIPSNLVAKSEVWAATRFDELSEREQEAAYAAVDPIWRLLAADEQL